MQNDLFTINYQKQFIATPKSEIFFFEGTPDLKKLFFSTEAKTEASNGRGETARKNDYGLTTNNTSGRRLFVIDTNVAALPCLKKFTALFAAKSAQGQKAAALKPGVYDGLGKAKNDALIILRAGEKHKTIKTVLQIVEAALDRAFTRKDVFCAIGGGVVTDMTAFASSIYKRGAVCEFVPTTLLSMVDAAIGGKSGCDFDEYKNMIGAFYPAQKLYVFPEFVQTLSAREYRSGFAEALKTAMLYDKKMFLDIQKNKEKVKARDRNFVFKMIGSCVKAKALVVQKDMTEKNIRMQLNLGHTFGHALETCAGLGKIAHGDAVAWGIGRALELSLNIGLCSKEYKESVFELLKYFGWETGAKAKCFCQPGGEKELLKAMRLDKKNSSSKIRVILQSGLCETVITEVSDKDILKCL